MVLAPLFIGYRLVGRVSSTRMRAAAIHHAFRGIATEHVRTRGLAYAAEVLPGILRAQVMSRIGWHQARGDAVAVVSGALDAYLAPWCEAHDVTLICSTLGVRDGVLSGRYAGAQCVMEEKARRVLQQFDLHAFEHVYAYDDTPEDEALPALADYPYYRGEPALVASSAPTARTVAIPEEAP